MDNNLSSILQGLNTYHQRTKIDKDSLIAGKIVPFGALSSDPFNALQGATTNLTSTYPNPTSYEIIDVTFTAADPTNIWVVITIRLN